MPTRVVHHAPDFCTVYVVAKTKIVMNRQAKSCSVTPSGFPPRHLAQQYVEHEDPVRSLSRARDLFFKNLAEAAKGIIN